MSKKANTPLQGEKLYHAPREKVKRKIEKFLKDIFPKIFKKF